MTGSEANTGAMSAVAESHEKVRLQCALSWRGVGQPETARYVRRNNSEMLQIKGWQVPLVAVVKEASTGRMGLTVSSPLGCTEHLMRQYQLGNIGYYCGCAERRFGSSLIRRLRLLRPE
jgi:hypothetical protein